MCFFEYDGVYCVGLVKPDFYFRRGVLLARVYEWVCAIGWIEIRKWKEHE